MSYRAHEFAKLAGVTVRALHHYDRIGLLQPSRRSDSGYRLYEDCDLARLEQIVVLKFLGLSLNQIRDLVGLADQHETLAEALRCQQAVLAEKRKHLDTVIRAIREAERSIEPGRATDWQQFMRIIKEIEMQNDVDWSKKYYNEDARAKVEDRRKLWSPALQERVSRDWEALFADVEAAQNEDPASEKVQALVVRWKKLLAEFTGGDAEIQKGLNAMYADQQNWPQAQQERYSIKPEIMAFITKAMHAGKN